MELIVTIIIAVIIKLIKEGSQGVTRPKREKKKNIWDEVMNTKQSDFHTSNTSATTEWQKKARENIAKVAERAKQNAAEEAMDETLYHMQIEHGHLETVSLAVHDHSQDLESGDIIETISDLMIKGYEGHLCFERDFLGEAMDMISHFQPPTELPTYQISEMKF